MKKTLKKIKVTKNKFEHKIWTQLKSNLVHFEYEGEKIPYIYAGHYTPDFVVDTPNGKIYLETKGYFRPEHKRVMKAAKKTNPNLDIRIVFYEPLSPKRRTQYVKWAIKNGFKYAFSTIPQEWLDGF